MQEREKDVNYTEEEATSLRKRREERRRSDFTDDTTNVIFMRFVGTTRFTLIRLNEDENVVHSNSQNQEGNHFDNNQSGRYSDVTVETD